MKHALERFIFLKTFLYSYITLFSFSAWPITDDPFIMKSISQLSLIYGCIPHVCPNQREINELRREEIILIAVQGELMGL